MNQVIGNHNKWINKNLNFKNFEPLYRYSKISGVVF